MRRRERELDAKIERDEKELETILTSLPENPIPWATVLKIVAPIVARLAVRYAIKKVNRGMAESKVSSAAASAGALIASILAKRLPDNG